MNVLQKGVLRLSNIKQLARKHYRRPSMVSPASACLELQIALMNEIEREETWHIELKTSLQ